MLRRGFKSGNGKACKEATEGSEERWRWLDKSGGTEVESSQQVRGIPGGSRKESTALKDGLYVKGVEN